jgi:hypothetical protein
MTKDEFWDYLHSATKIQIPPFPLGSKENPADLDTKEGEEAFVSWVGSNS